MKQKKSATYSPMKLYIPPKKALFPRSNKRKHNPFKKTCGLPWFHKMLVGNWEDLPWDLWGKTSQIMWRLMEAVGSQFWFLKWPLFRWFSMIFRGDLLGYVQFNHEHLFRFRGRVGEAERHPSLPTSTHIGTEETSFQNSPTGFSI